MPGLALAVALLAPAAAAQWIQIFTGTGCQGTPTPNFAPSSLTSDALVPFSVAGSPARCVATTDAAGSLYFEADSANATTMTRYRCSSTSCTDCQPVATLSSAGRAASLDCSNHFKLLTSTGSLDEGLQNILLSQGSGALASAYYINYVSLHSDATPCGAGIQRATIFYLFEECTLVLPGLWLISTADPRSKSIITYSCRSSNCQTACTKELAMFKPAPPGQTACHAAALLDRNLTSVNVLKASSRYNTPSSADFEPPATWLEPASAGPPGSSPTGAQRGQPPGSSAGNSLSSPTSPNAGLIVGAAAGGVAIVIATIGAFLAVRRARQATAHRIGESDFGLTAVASGSSSFGGGGSASGKDARRSSGSGSAYGSSHSISSSGADAGRRVTDRALIRSATSVPPSPLSGRAGTVLSSSLVGRGATVGSSSLSPPFSAVADEPGKDLFPIVEPPRKT